MKKIYKGIIKEDDYRENWDALFLDSLDTGSERPLAERIEDNLSYNRQATVRYFISDEPKNIDELTENLIRKISGDLAADYSDAYSEYTGYLWTDENLKVGGHDLLTELRDNQGRFAYIEIDYKEE